MATRPVADARPGADGRNAPANINDAMPRRQRATIDPATVAGLVAAFVMIGAALASGGGWESFLDLPSALIVIGGTFAVTTVSFTLEDIINMPRVVVRAVIRRGESGRDAAMQILKIAELARRGGPIAVEQLVQHLNGRRVLQQAAIMISDQIPDEEIEIALRREADSVASRHSRGAAVLRRAGEVAPAMGLIGTLIGLVKMLAELDDPNAIGPAMALALLTTFYGAMLGSVVLAPLAAKLERASADEALINQLIVLGAVSISRQENPRRLEMLLNSVLPPQSRVKYFD